MSWNILNNESFHLYLSQYPAQGACVYSEDSNQSAHPISLIRVLVLSEETFDPWLPIEHLSKMLIRLWGCTGWSEYLMGTLANLNLLLVTSSAAILSREPDTPCQSSAQYNLQIENTLKSSTNQIVFGQTGSRNLLQECVHLYLLCSRQNVSHSTANHQHNIISKHRTLWRIPPIKLSFGQTGSRNLLQECFHLYLLCSRQKTSHSTANHQHDIISKYRTLWRIPPIKLSFGQTGSRNLLQECVHLYLLCSRQKVSHSTANHQHNIISKHRTLWRIPPIKLSFGQTGTRNLLQECVHLYLLCSRQKVSHSTANHQHNIISNHRPLWRIPPIKLSFGQTGSRNLLQERFHLYLLCSRQ